MSIVPIETPKQQFIAVLQQQPDDRSHDDLLRELAFARLINRGLKDVEAGRVVSNEEIKQRIDLWRK